MKSFIIKQVKKLFGQQILELTKLLTEAIENNAAIDIDNQDISSYYSQLSKNILQGTADIVVAKIGGKIVGSAIAKYYTESYISHISDFRKLIVNKKFRNQGIGTALVTKLEDIVRKKGILKIEFSYREGNKAAHLYTDLGFRPWGKSTCAVRYNNQCYNEIHMEKILL